MPDYRRTSVPGGTYFFTLNTWHRQPVLTEIKLRHALRDGIQKARATLPFKIDAWVLLPDHMHCIWTLPANDNNFSSRWAIIKRHASKCYTADFSAKTTLTPSRQKRRESNLWQRRFWEHLIRDESDFNHHMDYIHWNPVKHAYVDSVMDWPYSSFHRYVKEGAYSVDWGGVGIDSGKGDYGER